MHVYVLLGTYNTCTYIHMCLCTHTFTFFAMYSGVWSVVNCLICISVMCECYSGVGSVRWSQLNLHFCHATVISRCMHILTFCRFDPLENQLWNDGYPFHFNGLINTKYIKKQFLFITLRTCIYFFILTY